MLFQSSCFWINVAGYSAMPNHYHAVLKDDKEKAGGLTGDEILNRWLKLYSGRGLAQRQEAGESLDELEETELKQSITQVVTQIWYPGII